MHHLYFDMSGLGLLILAAYIILDLTKNRGTGLVRKVVIYSFVFYILLVFQQTTGGLHIPPLPVTYRTVLFQPLPFRFIADWLELYRQGVTDWRLWYSVRASVFNVFLLFPLGIYLPLLFFVHSLKKAALFIALSSLTIEVYQVVFTCTGLVRPRIFNVDDILLNTLGGIVAFGMYKAIPAKWTGYISQMMLRGEKSARAPGER